MLTPEQVTYFQGYLDDLMQRLRMMDWDIQISKEPSDADCHAMISIVKGQRRADLYLGRLFPYEDAETIRHFMIHELVHALIRELPDSIAIVRRPLGTVLYGMLKEAHQTAEENTTDALAGILAALLPLPEPRKWMTQEGKKGKKPSLTKRSK